MITIESTVQTSGQFWEGGIGFLPIGSMYDSYLHEWLTFYGKCRKIIPYMDGMDYVFFFTSTIWPKDT